MSSKETNVNLPSKACKSWFKKLMKELGDLFDAKCISNQSKKLALVFNALFHSWLIPMLLLWHPL